MMPLWLLILIMVSNHLWLGTNKFIKLNLPTISLPNRKVHMDGLDARYRSPVVIKAGELPALPPAHSQRGELPALPLALYEPVPVRNSGSRCHSSNLVQWLVGERTRYINTPLAGLHCISIKCTLTGTAMITATDLLVSRARCPSSYTNHTLSCLTIGFSWIRPMAIESGTTPSTLHWCRDQDLVSRQISTMGGYFIVSPLYICNTV